MIAPQNPIARAIWDGALLIKFSLDNNKAEALGVKTIEPYFIEAPRCSYFPLLTSAIRKYFCDMAMNFIVDDAEIWHYPIGLLFDLHTGYRPDSNIIQESISPLSENGNQLTLGNVLHQILPDFFPSSSPPPISNESSFAAPIIHGIIPQLDIPIV
ncbi:17273_t:CDS:2 [Entrophospora sp. SA101]|nr:22823_t:CDS:2 [Entrophospora sp. SA101]CAJ0749374.1 17273_t:CDS:2 [Entrophospora sp. SA101]CAJ0825968.1 11060_t:CDS:2 [Entrophospora sp. SA101]CAJ0924452.1 9725_t:CDS:2 [Entrophospora sp. SA101]